MYIFESFVDLKKTMHFSIQLRIEVSVKFSNQSWIQKNFIYTDFNNNKRSIKCFY
jgi:hypothetical protein